MGNKTIGLALAFLVISCVSAFAGGEQDSATNKTVLYSVGTYNGRPCYWQNAVRRNLAIPFGAKGGEAGGITVGADGAVYIPGYYVNGNDNSIPCYWQNGERKDLPIPNGADGHAGGIAIGANGTVYISGGYADRNGNIIPCYWQDDIRYNIGVLENGEDIVSQFIVIR